MQKRLKNIFEIRLIEKIALWKPKTISAYTVYNRFEKKLLDEQEIIDAIAIYLRDYYSFDPNDLKIDLQYSEEDGIGEIILVS